jgi:hypothetical protein
VCSHVVRVRDHFADDPVGVYDECDPVIEAMELVKDIVGVRDGVPRPVTHQRKARADRLSIRLRHGKAVDADADDLGSGLGEIVLGFHEALQLLASAPDAGEKQERHRIEREDDGPAGEVR